MCVEVLFDPVLAGKPDCIPLPEAMYLAITSNIDPPSRIVLWEAILLTGGVSNIKGLEARLESEIAPFIAASETSNEFQAKEIKFLNVPEYFTVYKEKRANADYLGSCILAKVWVLLI